MSFEERLKLAAADTGAELDRILEMTGTPATRLVAAMRYAALAPGKRLRPFLVVESAALHDVPRAVAVQVGAALECIHCYSLAHDDLPAMDDDDLRRGQPTLHRAFDEASAILAGDALLTLAFEAVAQVDLDASRRVELVTGLAKAAGMTGMVAGQMLDMEAETRVTSTISEIVQIQSLKTGALFRFACTAGAIMAGAAADPLVRYADAIGLAFQIADDLLDHESTPEAMGKATQKDAARGKATFVDLLGVAGARAKAEALVHEAIAALSPFGRRADILCDAARFIVARKN